MNVAKLRSLTPSEWWLLLTSAVMLPGYALALRSGLYKPASWRLNVARQECQARPERQAVARAALLRLGYLVNAAARYSPWRPSCLVRSLVLMAQLRRRSIPCNLCIGVRIDDGQLKAHAWVEQHGLPLNDSADIATEFEPIDTGLGCMALARL